MKISVVINTYNEQDNIGLCLESVKWADEIVVIDMYSTDGTLSVIKKYTNNIYFYNRKNKYVEPARNYALSKAKYKWILVMDADETISQNAKEIIYKIVNNSKVDGYYIPRRGYIRNNKYLKYGYFYPDYQLRLFRNGYFHYSELIHVQATGNKTITKKISSIELYHNPSHCKYDSIFHFSRLFPYIVIEGQQISKNNRLNILLILFSTYFFIRHIYRSFVKLKGYKDGFDGFRAALIYATYRLLVDYFSLIYRIRLFFV